MNNNISSPKGNSSRVASLWRWIPARYRSAATAVGIGIAVFITIGMIPESQEKKPPVRQPSENVEVLEIVPIKELIDTLEIPGTVEPDFIVNVSAEVAGRIERMGMHRSEDSATTKPIKQGEFVNKSDEIVILNSDLLRAERDRANAQMEFDERDLARYKKLEKHSITLATEMEIDQCKTRLALSKAMLQGAQSRLDRTRITAPVSGTLDCIPVDVGEYVKPGALIAKIVNMKTAIISVDVPEKDIHFLSLGAKAAVSPREKGLARPEESEPIEGIITYISKLADPASRTTRVEITVDNASDKLVSQQIVRVKLTRRIIENAIMIPLLAVIPREKTKTVFIVKDGKAIQREVILDFVRGRNVRIIGGLESGDMLIVSGQQLIGPGEKVIVVSSEKEKSNGRKRVKND